MTVQPSNSPDFTSATKALHCGRPKASRGPSRSSVSRTWVRSRWMPTSTHPCASVQNDDLRNAASCMALSLLLGAGHGSTSDGEGHGEPLGPTQVRIGPPDQSPRVDGQGQVVQPVDQDPEPDLQLE